MTMLTNEKNPDFLKMLEYAIKAPSGHNTQPWKFKINEHDIEVYPNLNLELTVIDANHRELYVSIGCAVENICIAANTFGYVSQSKIIRQNNLCFIRIELSKSFVNAHSLFPQIDKRQTNRSVYKSTLIPEDIILTLQTLEIKKPVSIFLYKNGSHEFGMLSQYIFQGNETLFNNEDFINELLDWIRYNPEAIEKYKDGLGYHVLGSPSLPDDMGKIIIGSVLNPETQNKAEKEKINSSSHLVLFAIEENTIENWILAGQSLQRFLLKCTELQIDVAYANQPCELRLLAEDIRVQIAINKAHPTLLLRIGYGTSMPFSVRRLLQDSVIN